MAVTNAIQLVVLNPDTGKYQVGQDAAELLAQLGESPVAVVSIAGDLRQGKSFILNKLASTTGAFPVSASHKPCTHGIWMRTKHVDGDGGRLTIVFLDTEGTASYEQTAQSSATIVSLAGLVSSLLIYNKRGVFDENCVDSLFSAARILEKLFTVKGGGTESIMSPPQLLVLLRDWSLDLEGMTPSEHLQKILEDMPFSADNMQGIMDKNKQRHIIRSMFSQRSCHLLPHPGCDTTIMEDLPDSKLSEKFVKGICELSTAVYSQATPKLVQGKPMTGPIMLQLLEAAVNTVNTPGQVINLPTVWGAMVAMELQAAASAARQVYKSATSSLDDCVDLPAAVEMHKAALTKSKTAHGSLCSNAGKEECRPAWQEVLQQLQSSFVLVSERIKRKEAEAILQHAKMVDAARLQAQNAFDEGGLLASLANNSVLESYKAEAAFKGHYNKAMSVFDNAVSSPSTTMKASPAAPDKAASAAATRAAAVAAARAELEKVLQHAHSTMMVQLKARVAMDQARLAVAEKQRLEQEQRREQQLQQAKEAAINKYRDSMKRLMYAMEELPAMLGLDDMSSLSSAHKDTLSQLYRSMPKDLSARECARFKQDVGRACEEVFAANKQVVQQRIQQADRDVLKNAVQQGLEAFQQAVKGLPTDCSDPAVAKKTCLDATAAALVKFTSVASKQSSFPTSSTVYMAAEDSLRMDVAARAQQLQNAADALQKSQQVAQAALRKQREEAEAARQQAQLRLRQMEQQLQWQRDEDARREWEELRQQASEAREMRICEAIERQRCYQPVYYTPCYQSSRSCQYADDDDDVEDDY